MTRLLQNACLAVDGRLLGAGGTGVATYARALAEAQRALSDRAIALADDSTAPVRRFDRVRRWLRAAIPASVHAGQVDEHRLHTPDLFRLAQVHFDIYRRLLTVIPPTRGGIMHWSYPVPIRVAGWRNIYTIHDAIPLTDPSLTRIDPARHRTLLRRIVQSADALVTVSEAAKNQIAAALSLDPDRLSNCSQPVVLAESSPPPGGLPAGGYLLAIGTVEPRKNISRLVAAYGASGVTLPLVFAGPTEASSADLEALLRSTAGIVRLPYVPAADMPGLIAGARALVMPSLAEGFGLPIAEAMTLGTPVITSDHGALAETAGGAALLVATEDVRAMAAAIFTLSVDQAECARLARLGRRNAERFTMPLFIQRLEAVYADFLPRPARADSAIA